ISGLRPFATMSGIAAWSSGCQSGATKRSRACFQLYAALLPGIELGLSSGGGTLTVGSHKKAQAGSPSDDEPADAPCAMPSPGAEVAIATRIDKRMEIFSSDFKLPPLKKTSNPT